MIFKKIINPLFWYYFIKKKNILKKIKKYGDNFIFDPRSSFLKPELMEIGDNVFIGEYAYISAEIKIGHNVMFGPRPIIVGGNHYFGIRGESVRFLYPKKRENSKQIVINEEVWCGSSVIILGGVHIGIGSVIGAGSVVVNDIPSYVVAVGNPCRPVKMIFEDDVLVDHLVKLGKDISEAIMIKEARGNELKRLNLEDLPIVDKTNEYWKFKK